MVSPCCSEQSCSKVVILISQAHFFHLVHLDIFCSKMMFDNDSMLMRDVQ